MSAALGKKINCTSCSVMFYDLKRAAPECPKCGKVIKAKVAKPVKVEVAPVEEKEVDPKSLQHIDNVGDIDLTGFEEEKMPIVPEGGITDIENVDELEDDVDSLSEVENREVPEDRMNSDDADDDLAIEKMDELETLVDKVEDEEQAS